MLSIYLLDISSFTISLILILLFFDISIALHELGHFYTAKLCKLKIKYVYLHLFFSRTIISPSKFLFAFPRRRLLQKIGGGVVLPKQDIRTGHEFIILLTGPAVNFILFLGSLFSLYYFGWNLEIANFGCVNLLMVFLATTDWSSAKDCWNVGFLNKGKLWKILM